MKEKNRFLLLTGVAIQMGLTIFLGAYFGRKLDEKYTTDKKWFTMLFTLLAVFISLYNIINQLKKINTDEGE